MNVLEQIKIDQYLIAVKVYLNLPNIIVMNYYYQLPFIEDIYLCTFMRRTGMHGPNNDLHAQLPPASAHATTTTCRFPVIYTFLQVRTLR